MNMELLPSSSPQSPFQSNNNYFRLRRLSTDGNNNNHSPTTTGSGSGSPPGTTPTRSSIKRPIEHDDHTPVRHTGRDSPHFRTPLITCNVPSSASSALRCTPHRGGDLFHDLSSYSGESFVSPSSPTPPTVSLMENYDQMSAPDFPFSLNITNGTEERLRNLSLSNTLATNSELVDGDEEEERRCKVSSFLSDCDESAKSGWYNWGQLGEGSFAEVRLFENRQSRQAFAVKKVDLRHFPDAGFSASTEVNFLSRLQHPNVVKFYGWTQEGPSLYIFLEYVPGGELFDQIVPDVGIKNRIAIRYLSQILDAVEFMHAKGIAHRDLKPENVLLDEHDNIRVIDFGFACKFDISSTKPSIRERVGTELYMAPEIIRNVTYYPPYVDMWAIGIILFGMLAGELPWAAASIEDPLYRLWKEGKLFVYKEDSPWRKMDPDELALVRKILNSAPSKRATISKIRADPLYRRLLPAVARPQESPLIRKIKRARPVSYGSQPPLPLHCQDSNSNSQARHMNGFTAIRPLTTNNRPRRQGIIDEDDILCFSQPATFQDMMLEGDSLSPVKRFTAQGGGGKPSPRTAAHNRMSRLVKRMTRFFTTKDTAKTSHILVYVLEKMGYRVEKSRAPKELVVTATQAARQKGTIKFKIDVIGMREGRQVLVDFRRISGDAFEFKRHFQNIRECLAGEEGDDFLDSVAPFLSWNV